MRNELLFQNIQANHQQVPKKSRKLAFEIVDVFQSNLNNIAMYKNQLIHWVLLDTCLIKINTDGSKTQSLGSASFGALARNEEWRWVEGFCGRVGATLLGAELWGIHQRLKLAKERAWEGVFVESDSKVAIDIINSEEDDKNQPERILIEECHSLKRQVNAKVWHILKEADRCPNKLAKLGSTQTEQHVRIIIPPDDVVEDLMADLVGVSYPRGY